MLTDLYYSCNPGLEHAAGRHGSATNNWWPNETDDNAMSPSSCQLATQLSQLRLQQSTTTTESMSSSDSSMSSPPCNIDMIASSSAAAATTTTTLLENCAAVKRSANTTECVAVPSSEHVAEIVGRQGCKIKALRAKTNTYIKTPVRGEEPVFVITGRQDDVTTAKQEILSAADHFTQIRASRRACAVSTSSSRAPAAVSSSSAAGSNGQVTCEVRVPVRVVGLVVGPKGSTVKKIQQDTQTYIVTPSRGTDPVFEVIGLPGNVERARREIESYIHHRPTSTSTLELPLHSSASAIGSWTNPSSPPASMSSSSCSPPVQGHDLGDSSSSNLFSPLIDTWHSPVPPSSHTHLDSRSLLVPDLFSDAMSVWGPGESRDPHLGSWLVDPDQQWFDIPPPGVQSMTSLFKMAADFESNSNNNKSTQQLKQTLISI